MFDKRKDKVNIQHSTRTKHEMNCQNSRIQFYSANTKRGATDNKILLFSYKVNVKIMFGKMPFITIFSYF